MSGTRIDVVLSRRGVARSRTHAASLIKRGLVSVDGVVVSRASTRVRTDQRVDVGKHDALVGRGAVKLIAALDAFSPLKTSGVLALDVGASTGGFTQVLLNRGVRRVIALDVGHGQLAPEIAADPRVTSVERVNARWLTATQLSAISGTDEAPTLVVADLSFISLTVVIPALVASSDRAADFVLLVKPQFEAGRAGLVNGIVTSSSLRATAVSHVVECGHTRGLSTAGIIASPILGAAGNHEYLVWLSSTAGSNPAQWREHILATTR